MTDPASGSGATADSVRLRILFCADPAYFQHVAVAAVSLAENNRQSLIDVHVLTCDSDIGAEEMLKNSVARCGHVSLTIQHMTASRLDNFFVDKHVSKETYLRTLAPEALPSDIRRIIYLDSDLVVLADLRPLWNLDLSGKALAAAPDYTHPQAFAPGQRAALGIPPHWTYVNAGVLLVDLEQWRQGKFTQRLVGYIERQGFALKFWDQDAINAVLHEAIRPIDCRWNLQARMYRLARRSFSMELEATREARQRPAIIHFTGPEKPWLFRSRTARKQDYFRYLKKTAWRDARPKLKTPTQLVEYRIDRLLLRCGLDYLQMAYKIGRVQEKLAELMATAGHRAFKLLRRRHVGDVESF